MIAIDDFKKVNLIVGEVSKVNQNCLEINSGDKKYKVNLKLDVIEGEKIIIGLNEGKVVIPIVGGEVLIVDGDLDVGSKVG